LKVRLGKNICFCKYQIKINFDLTVIQEHFGDDETGNQENRTERAVALISKSVKKYSIEFVSYSVCLASD
jgi:hypothetical protein